MLIERKKERKRVLQTKVKSLCCNGRILKKRLNASDVHAVGLSSKRIANIINKYANVQTFNEENNQKL